MVLLFEGRDDLEKVFLLFQTAFNPFLERRLEKEMARRNRAELPEAI